jgi:hypothetical protein
MALRAVEHDFHGPTTPLAVLSYGSVAVSGTAVTGTGTFFNSSMVGMSIGFGYAYLSGVTTWYTISAYNSPTSLTLSTSAGTISAGSAYVITGYDSTKTSIGPSMIQKSGYNPEDNFIGPFPIPVARPAEESTAIASMFPHVITVSATIDWVFLVSSAATTNSAIKYVVLYEFNKVTFTYNWKGFITVTLNTAVTHTTRGFRAMRYLHTTGTVEVAGPVSVYSTGTVTVAVAGTVTHSSTGFLPDHVGLMIGFGTTDVTKVNCWYPIISNTSTSILVVSGVTSAFAAGTAFVIASCVVTGTGTQFVTEGIAAGANSVSAAGLTSGLGPRIGFGSTDPNQITQWYQIGRISSDTSINLVTSPGVIAPGTPYVIEELRFVIVTTGSTATSGGVFLLKGAGYMDFRTSGNTFPAIATAIDNQRGVYWLSDAGTTTGTNVVTNTASCGCAITPEINKGLHYIYVINGTGSTYVNVYRYNIRATGTITTGKMLMSIAYTTAGTVTVSGGTTVTCSGATPFTEAMIGMKIGFSSTSPALITTWYTIVGFTSTTVITIDTDPGVVSGSAYVIDSADVLCTAPQLVTGTISANNNGRVGTLRHGSGKEVPSLYFVTTTRIYRAALSGIFAGNMDWISDNRTEIPPGSINTFPVTNALSMVEISDAIDRLIVLSTGTAGAKHYVTRYPAVAGEQFDRTFGIDTKQQDVSTADPNAPVYYNTNSLVSSVWSQNGIAHIIKHGTTLTQNQMYALPLGAHWFYTEFSDERVITPAILTPDCVSYNKVMISALDHLGSEEFRMPTASVLIYYRTKGIVDNTGSWIPAAKDGSLSGLSPSDKIQFMFEFTTVGLLGIPGRLMSVAVLYEDYSTEPHYQPSSGKTVEASKQFAWRFATAFGTTVPILRVRLFDAVTGGLLVDDDTVSPTGIFDKTIDDGSNWIAYNTADKTNEITYIRYVPATLPDNVKVRALLTLY